MIFLLPLFMFTIINGEEIFENATLLCQQRCICSRSDDAQILTLNCNNQDLHHMLSTWPPHNTTIIATFAENNITTLETLPPTDAVVEINLSKCSIEYLYPGLFDATKNIKAADLSHNLLTAEEITPEKFMGPYHHTEMEPIKLEELNLAYNQIHTLNKGVFEYLPNLKKLNLEGNDFAVLDVHTQLALSSLTDLVYLNLASNELTELVKSAIEGYKNLVELDLSKNELDFVPVSLSILGKSLEILILDDNPIIEFTEETFMGLDNLNELSANNLTKLKRIEANTFASKLKLRKLSLSDNVRLEDIDRQAFAANQTTIKELYLNNNNLTRIDYKLLRWSELNVFEFKRNPLDCSCDLYNITSALSPDLTRNQDGPYCTDPRDNRPFKVYDLKRDICTAKMKLGPKRVFHFSIPLGGLIATLILALFVAVSLAYNRYRKFLGNKNYHFASQVLYNPLPTTNPRF